MVEKVELQAGCQRVIDALIDSLPPLPAAVRIPPSATSSPANNRAPEAVIPGPASSSTSATRTSVPQQPTAPPHSSRGTAAASTAAVERHEHGEQRDPAELQQSDSSDDDSDGEGVADKGQGISGDCHPGDAAKAKGNAAFAAGDFKKAVSHYTVRGQGCAAFPSVLPPERASRPILFCHVCLCRWRFG